jgi:hypothetical protein
MKHMTAAAGWILVTLCVSLNAADKVDPRLASIHKAVITAEDDLSDDRPVALCLAEKLAEKTPVEVVKSKADADAVITVRKASVGKHPKAEVTVALIDGTALWQGGSKTRGFNLVGRNMTCVIADDLASNLRNAVKKARGK